MAVELGEERRKANLRLECLRLAVKSGNHEQLGGGTNWYPPADIVERARTYADFVLGTRDAENAAPSICGFLNDPAATHCRTAFWKACSRAALEMGGEPDDLAALVKRLYEAGLPLLAAWWSEGSA